MVGTRLKYKLYFVSGVLLCLCTISMFYFGYKTFYIEPEHTEATEYTYHFALVGEEDNNDYWNLIKKGAQDAAKENDIYLDYIAPRKADNNEALTLLDRMISAKVDGIITHGIPGQKFVDLVHKGNERGIPIITIDMDVEASERKTYIGSDNYKAGQQLGQSIISNTTGKQFIGVVTGRLDSISQQERVEGLKQVIDINDDVELVTVEESNITETGAARATYKVLKEHPEITVMVGTSALDGIGIVEGLKEIAPTKNVLIVAFDNLPQTLHWIKEDRIDVTIAQHPEEMGYKSVKTMRKLKNNDLSINKQYIDTIIIKKEDLLKNDRHGEEQ